VTSELPPGSADATSTKASDAIVTPSTKIAPASTTVHVVALVLPEAMVEVDAVAFIPASSRSRSGNPGCNDHLSPTVITLWVIWMCVRLLRSPPSGANLRAAAAGSIT
jgi:hypothetical protein